ncbi:protein shisa-9B [Periophthalmus magnuspinnatus]|uniref:protein shisa-9B n=1 Tax=Periophthalmus magnuspinnatus TaxID=409849 RepID=UPI00145B5D88|nr:protein shisa-9B [Periophthalmus magnuspinnatus]
MRVAEHLLVYFLVKVMVCDAEGEPGHTEDDFLIGYNDSVEIDTSETPHTEDKCRGYYDVMGQWDPPFVCRTGNYLYCCGTCGFRFCCAFKSSRLDQTTCKNYDTPPWMMTGRPPPKVDVALDASKDKTNLIVYVICGVVAIMALIGIFTKLGLEKTHRPNRENMSRALANVIHHSENDGAVGQHYENLQSRMNSLHNDQLNNSSQASTLIPQPYPVPDLTSPYDHQLPVKDINTYATLKAVAEKVNLYSFRQQSLEMSLKGGLPMESLEDVEPSNPYSPPRHPSLKHSRHKPRPPRSHSSQSLYYSNNSPALLRSWDSRDTLGLRQVYTPQKLCVIEKELHTTRYMPPQPYFVTNSKTEVTV